VIPWLDIFLYICKLKPEMEKEDENPDEDITVKGIVMGNFQLPLPE